MNLPLTPQQYVDLCDLLTACAKTAKEYSEGGLGHPDLYYETIMATPDLLAALRKVRGNPEEEAEVARLDSARLV